MFMNIWLANCLQRKLFASLFAQNLQKFTKCKSHVKDHQSWTNLFSFSLYFNLRLRNNLTVSPVWCPKKTKLFYFTTQKGRKKNQPLMKKTRKIHKTEKWKIVSWKYLLHLSFVFFSSQKHVETKIRSVFFPFTREPRLNPMIQFDICYMISDVCNLLTSQFRNWIFQCDSPWRGCSKNWLVQLIE